MAKTWMNTVQNSYVTIEDLEYYDEIYNVCFRAGYSGINRVKQMWDDNKVIGGSVNPEDFGAALPEELAKILVKEYQEAVVFTEEDLDGHDFSDESVEEIKDELLRFIEFVGWNEIQKIMGFVNDWHMFKEMFAHDFWLTRNGHGSGFWDSPVWREYKDLLTEKSRKMGQHESYLGDDGLIYFLGGK